MEYVDKVVEQHNKVLKKDSIRIGLIVLTAVFIGYSLQPVPAWLNNLFNTSIILRFFILYFTGIASAYPITRQNMTGIIISSILFIILFEILRKFN